VYLKEALRSIKIKQQSVVPEFCTLQAGPTVDVVLASSAVVDAITGQAERLMNREKQLNLHGVAPVEIVEHTQTKQGVC
jgi:hypothetical protein